MTNSMFVSAHLLSKERYAQKPSSVTLILALTLELVMKINLDTTVPAGWDTREATVKVTFVTQAPAFTVDTAECPMVTPNVTVLRSIKATDAKSLIRATLTRV